MTKTKTAKNSAIILLLLILFSNSSSPLGILSAQSQPTEKQDTTIVNASMDESSPVTQVKSLFRVTTDYGYKCTSGDPGEAIQNAINSLPTERTQPCNIYLKGVFNPVSNIVMASNVNFIGKNATVISQDNAPLFVHPWSDYNSELYGTIFKIKGKPYQDWITLHNVTFTSITFKQWQNYTGQTNNAIYFYDGNSTGWGRSNNLSVFNCSFNGFYNCIQGIAMNSSFIGNRFFNYSNNAIMFPLGANLTIKNNIFRTPANAYTVNQYQKMDGKSSIQGGIGLFLMDVNGWATITNNTFWQGKKSIGLTFSSCPGSFWVTENVFSGPGKAYAFDIFPRPWKSSGIVFFNNLGVEDFCYNKGVYS